MFSYIYDWAAPVQQMHKHIYSNNEFDKGGTSPPLQKTQPNKEQNNRDLNQPHKISYH